MAKSHDKYAGAGGQWPARDEAPDPNALAQAGTFYCCAACISMDLAERGIHVDQYGIAEKAGVPTPWVAMRAALNAQDPDFVWAQAWFPTSRLPFLNRKAPWIAWFKDYGNDYHHAVVIDGFDPNGRVCVRDPRPPGTRYFMALEDFENAQHGWTGVAVYRKRRKPRRR